jgi:hypothetical protein
VKIDVEKRGLAGSLCNDAGVPELFEKSWHNDLQK